MITKGGIQQMISKAFDVNSTFETPTQFSVGKNTSKPSFIDTNVKDPIEITPGEYKKVFSIGYPMVDLEKLEVKTRMFLNTLEANDEDITEIGTFEQGNNTLLSRNVFTPITKTDSVEIAIIKSDMFVPIPGTETFNW